MLQLLTASAQNTEVVEFRRRLQWAELKIQKLEEQLRLARILKYGSASEKMNDAQLSLHEGEPGVSGEEVLAEAARGAPPTIQPQGGGRKHPGRQTLSADLPRVKSSG